MADIEVQTKLINLVRELLPPGVSPMSDEMMVLWVKKAAGEINKRRAKTTRKEVTITLAENQTSYELPEDCVKVAGLVLVGQDSVGGGLSPSQFPLEGGYGGCLPTGQRITASLDVIRRQEQTRAAEEVSWRIESGELVIEFRPVDGATMKVVYSAEDMSVEALPERHHLLVVTYVRMEILTAHIERIAAASDHTADKLLSLNLAEIARSRDNLRSDWYRELGAIVNPEVN